MLLETNLFLEAVGWLAQGFFFLRFLIQWWASERAKRIVVPSVFWWMSLFGAVCAGAYALYRENLVFLASPVVNIFIYGRNIALERTGRSLSKSALVPLGPGLVVLVAVAFATKLEPDQELLWFLLGSAGQLCWISRFPLQWWISERRGATSLPPAFFWVSFAGSLLLLTYAIHTGVVIFIVGMVLGPFLYGRSLFLCYRTAVEAPSVP